MLTAGVFAVQTGATLIVVVTEFDVPVVCPVADAVTVVVSVPDVWPALALTVSVIAGLVAPAESETELEPSVDVSKLVVLLSEEESAYVTFKHPLPVSLFLIVIE